jgi:hypothetical protein
LALIAFAVGDRFPHVVAAETGPESQQTAGRHEPRGRGGL